MRIVYPIPSATLMSRRRARIVACAAPLRLLAACALAFTGTSLLVMQAGVRTAMEADIRQPDFSPENYRDLIDGVFLGRFGGPGVLFLAAAAACVLLTVFHARFPARLNWLGWPVLGAAVLCSCFLRIATPPGLDLLVSSTYDLVEFHVDRHDGMAPAWHVIGSLALWLVFPAASLCQLWRRPAP